MKQNCFYITLIALLSMCLTTSCNKENEEPEPISVAFTSLAANGSATETTTVLTLTFDKAIEALTADDITLTAGTTGATKGALTAKTNGVYELALSGITAAGEVGVAVAKEGYVIAPASMKASISLYAPMITNKALIAAIEAAASITLIKDAAGHVSVTANKSIIEGVTSLKLNAKKLTDIEGVEYFTELTSLNCVQNDLTTLDVSKLTKLTSLSCQHNAKLATLILPSTKALTYLNCSRCVLTTLDLSGFTSIKTLGCCRNRLSTLDLSTLSSLSLSGNSNTCGTQTSNGSTAQEVAVTVTQTQLDTVGDDFNDFGDNRDIKWIVK